MILRGNSEVAKRLRGRRIVKVQLNAFRDGRGSWTASPVLVLDDGTSLAFDVQETEGSNEYGVDLVLHGPDKGEA